MNINSIKLDDGNIRLFITQIVPDAFGVNYYQIIEDRIFTPSEAQSMIDSLTAALIATETVDEQLARAKTAIEK